MAEKKKKLSKTEAIQAELDELKSLLQRTQADFVNYRRRNEEDRSNFAKMATTDIIEQILPVLDNFQMAAKHVPEDLVGDNWVVGVQAIEKQLEQILSANGLEKTESVGKMYDANTMEAVGEEDRPDEEGGIVLAEQLPGYLLNGKLIRPARVVVNKNN